MFDKIQNMMLERHVKSKLKLWYAMQGIDLDKVEKMTYKEIVQLLDKLVNGLQDENHLFKTRNQDQQKTISNLTEKCQGLQIRNQELFERNERMSQRLSISMQHNISAFKEMKTEKSAGIER